MTRSRFLFAVVVFLAAFLLFLVEPMVAKQLVPLLGGSAAVWITCLVFFQTALLCAYAYAHWFVRHPRWILHLVLLAAAVNLAPRRAPAGRLATPLGACYGMCWTMAGRSKTGAYDGADGY